MELPFVRKVTLQFWLQKNGQSNFLRIIRPGYAAVFLLELLIRILPDTWMYISC